MWHPGGEAEIVNSIKLTKCMLHFFKECGVLFRMSVRLIEVPLSSFLMKVYSCFSSRFNFNCGSS